MKPITKTELKKLCEELDKIDYDYFCEEHCGNCFFCPINKLCNYRYKVVNKYQKRLKEEKKRLYE